MVNNWGNGPQTRPNEDAKIQYHGGGSDQQKYSTKTYQDHGYEFPLAPR